MSTRGMKRAITLAGGGPAAGLHIGALKRLKEEGIEFDVWALSCIGAWVGVVYNSFDDREAAPLLTEQFFRDNVFRDDISYASFPVNHAFAPDFQQSIRAFQEYVMNPASYQYLVSPEAIYRTMRQTWETMTNSERWNEGDINNLMLEMCAANPMTRFMTGLMYLSKVNGLSRIYYKNSTFMKSIDVENLYKPDRPCIYHNAWDLDNQKIQLFSNHHMAGMGEMLPLSRKSLCACSALPFVEETVEIGGITYCEGALVETVNFDRLLELHPDLEEVWVVRIVDARQVKKPENLTDGLSNLCMLFAASLGLENVEVFEDKVRHSDRNIKIVRLHVSSDVDFEWNHRNLQVGIHQGHKSASEAIRKYKAGENVVKSAGCIAAEKAKPVKAARRSEAGAHKHH